MLGDRVDRAVRLDEDDVQRNVGVAHPEGAWAHLLEIKQHSGVVSQFLHIHQAARAGLGRVNDLDGELVISGVGLDGKLGLVGAAGGQWHGQ